MITYSGVHIQKVGGVEGTPTSVDIAVHAGRICRYGGAVWYPLLPHLVFVGLLAYQRSGSWINTLWGFLHDAHECVTSDVPRPFKCGCMKQEQSAIDRRLIHRYFSLTDEIDFRLIKECDKDALHIEAVQLGLPNFAEIELAYASDYLGEKEIHNDAQDVALFKRILASPFYGDTQHDGCKGVNDFAHTLEKARFGHMTDFRYNVESWRLLKVDTRTAPSR